MNLTSELILWHGTHIRWWEHLSSVQPFSLDTRLAIHPFTPTDYLKSIINKEWYNVESIVINFMTLGIVEYDNFKFSQVSQQI